MGNTGREHNMVSTLGMVCLALFLIILCYFTVGIIVGWRHGARGCELIPHLDFWKSIPGACVGGIQWLLYRCNVRRQNQSAYEEIQKNNPDKFPKSTVELS